jgi:acetate kinase
VVLVREVPGVRSMALQGLQCMGIKLDDKRNREANGFADVCRISTDDSPVTVLIVPTDEERMIARETLTGIKSFVFKRHCKSTEKASHFY